jgi:Ser/Thr protein kinase RdoA (MazF antagonist)
MLLTGELDSDHVVAFGTLLGRIHLTSRQQSDLAARFPDDLFDALRLEPYYRYSAEQVPESAPFLHDLIDETTAVKLSLVHGDYSPKNVLVHQGQLFLLDHEVIHWGDPTFDLGFSMTHFLSKAHHLSEQRQAFADATLSYWGAYRAAAAEFVTPLLEARAVRHTLGCLLGRVAGRSPLEYLGAEERSRQQGVVLQLMQRPPHTVAGLAKAFIERINL